jgi:hypothetical protein
MPKMSHKYMNSTQRKVLMDIANRLSLIAYVIGQEANNSTDATVAYDMAMSLEEIEAELLTVPYKE